MDASIAGEAKAGEAAMNKVTGAARGHRGRTDPLDAGILGL